MSKSVWVLRGTTGEYSDRTDWIVAAYKKEDDAVKTQQDLSDLFAKMWKEVNGYWWEVEFNETTPEPIKTLWDTIKKIDSQITVDYTGVSWWVTEVELR